MRLQTRQSGIKAVLPCLPHERAEAQTQQAISYLAFYTDLHLQDWIKPAELRRLLSGNTSAGGRKNFFNSSTSLCHHNLLWNYSVRQNAEV